MSSLLSCLMPSHKTAALILFLLPACGPGTTGVGDGGGGSSQSDSLHVVPGQTGVVNTLGSTPVGGTVFAGDEDGSTPGVNTRGILTFDLTTIPIGKTIRTAYLKVIQSQVEGSPYSDLGNLLVDHVVVGGIDSVDFDIGALISGFAVLSDTPAGGSRLANVFQRVKADLAAGRTVSQFRIRFSVKDGDNDGADDIVRLNDVTDDPPPIIILTYNQ